jgi:carbon monoxide dehydrogenase subunit G
MRIDKKFSIDASQDEVWQFVSAPEKVGLCFPGCQQITALGDDRYKAKIKFQLGPIKTIFNIDFEETEKRPQEYLSYTSTGEEDNRSSRLKAQSSLTFSPLENNHTQVVYASDISIVGRLGKFGMGMMKKKADSMGDEFIQALRSKIEGPVEAALIAPETAGKVPANNRRIYVVAAIAAAALFVIYYVLTRQ